MTPLFWISMGSDGWGYTPMVASSDNRVLPDGIDGFGQMCTHRRVALLPPDDDVAVEVYRWMIDLGWKYYVAMTNPSFSFMKLLATRGLR